MSLQWFFNEKTLVYRYQLNLDNPDTLSAFLAAQEWAAQRQQMMAASRIYPDAALPSYEEAASKRLPSTSKPMAPPPTGKTATSTTRDEKPSGGTKNSSVSSIDLDNLPSYEAALKILLRNEPDFSLPNVPYSNEGSVSSTHERNERIIE